MAHEIVGENLVTERSAFTFSRDKGEEIRGVPFVYTPNFNAKVADTIQQHKRQVLVTLLTKFYIHIDTLGLLLVSLIMVVPFLKTSCG